MATVIQTEALTKQYKQILAVDDVNLQIEKGEIYGFLGLNGAGKTTTIRMLLGLVKPSRGKVYVFGQKVDKHPGELWNRVGQVVEIPYAYPELTVFQNLEIFRRLRGLKSKDSIDTIVEQLYLSRYLDVKARNLSLGNVQRLGIAKAMIHQPEILILDEPANGLDPAGILQIRKMLLDLAQNKGLTIFVSSHILGEISKMATRIGIIHNGRMIRETETAILKNSRERYLSLVTKNLEESMKVLSRNSFLQMEMTKGELKIMDKKAIEEPDVISTILVREGLPPLKLALEEEDLEHYFFRIIKNSDQS